MILTINPLAYWIVLTPVALILGAFILIGLCILAAKALIWLLGPRDRPKQPRISAKEFDARIKEALKEGPPEGLW
jgi:hypothetical protein